MSSKGRVQDIVNQQMNHYKKQLADLERDIAREEKALRDNRERLQQIKDAIYEFESALSKLNRE